MKISLWISVGLGMVSFAMQAVASEEQIKPGLWEIQHHGDMASSGGASMKMPDMNQMQEMMKNMPPEARAQMEKHMNNNGMAAPNAGGVQVCISPEQAARNEFPADPNSECKLVNSSRSGNTITAKMACKNGEMESSVTLHSPESWSSNMKGNMQHSGQTMAMNMQAEGKWLSSDCGSLKPMGASAQ